MHAIASFCLHVGALPLYARAAPVRAVCRACACMLVQARGSVARALSEAARHAYEHAVACVCLREGSVAFTKTFHTGEAAAPPLKFLTPTVLFGPKNIDPILRATPSYPLGSHPTYSLQPIDHHVSPFPKSHRPMCCPQLAPQNRCQPKGPVESASVRTLFQQAFAYAQPLWIPNRGAV